MIVSLLESSASGRLLGSVVRGKKSRRKENLTTLLLHAKREGASNLRNVANKTKESKKQPNQKVGKRKGRQACSAREMAGVTETASSNEQVERGWSLTNW